MALLLDFLTLFVASVVAVSNCPISLTPSKSIRPSVAAGYEVALVATGLAKPRSIAFDTLGNLLVVQQDVGIINLAFQDDGGTCLSVQSQREVISSSELNHGLAISQDGGTIYASSVDAAYSWAYDAQRASVSDSNSTLVSGMVNSGHTTRTLLLSRIANNTLLISRGSASNFDPAAKVVSSGNCQIKAFDLANVPDDGYNFNKDGQIMGWGLRNSVGMAEHPGTGGIFSVENSADQLERDGQDIHQDNPGEEMNFHGFLNASQHGAQGSNYGYPYCFAAWMVDDIPRNANLRVGSQFVAGDQTSGVDDAFCAEQTPPILTFQAHMAPLDIEFNNSATEAWVTFHGSWNRAVPVGYKLSIVPFEKGNPVASPENKTAAVDILANADNSVCPENCFRPVGIAFDRHGRLFLSSDATGEIYVVTRAQQFNLTERNTMGSNPSDSSSTSSAFKNIMNFLMGISSLALLIFITMC